jgi:hypothetical protein
VIERELRPPPLDEWKNYITEDQRRLLPVGEAAEEYEELRKGHLAAVRQADIRIVSITVIGNYALVVAWVNLIYDPASGLETPPGYRGETRLYEFRRERDLWLADSTSVAYTDDRFNSMFSSALEAYLSEIGERQR